MFSAQRCCKTPWYTESTGQTYDMNGYCSNAADCINPDIVVDVTDKPQATAPSNFMTWVMVGAALLLAVGAFAGGRASAKSAVAPGTRKRVTKSFWVTF